VDILPMAEYDWYEWLNFRDTSVNFPDSTIHWGRDMGTIIGIGHAMARKVLHVKGKVMHYTFASSLSLVDIQSPSETRAPFDFDEALEKKLGPSMTNDDFKNDP
jgi:hypothetical protein